MDLEVNKHSSKSPRRSPDIQGESPSISGAVADQDEGLPVEVFAAQNHLPVPEVWRKVRAGELIGRTHGGRLIIYGSLEGAKKFAQQAKEQPDIPIRSGADSFRHQIDPKDLRDLPPLPPVAGEAEDTRYLSLSGQRGDSPELALLLDHLSLAKEENREILRLTQDSLKRVTELSDQVVEMKDAVIDAKEAKIKALEEQLAARESAISKLQQDNEDLETLARAMTKPSHRK